jgi:hypothetical protein
VRRADNLTTFMCRLSWNLGASTSWNPQRLSRPVMGLLYHFLLDWLQLSDWRWTLWSETCTGRRYFEKINIKFNRGAFCGFTLCDYTTTTHCGTTQKRAVLSATWSTILNEVFPCFFLSCKANARVKPSKTGHGQHYPNFCVVLCIVCFVSFTVLFVCIRVLNYCHRKATQLELNISYQNLTCNDPGFDATHRSEKPTNNHLSHDKALKYSYTLIISPWCMQMLHVIYGT